jgi:nitrile hydratase accessory protein
MNKRDAAHGHLIGLTRNDDEPLFHEAWEAEAFALTLQLHEAGVFTWGEWTQALSSQIEAAKKRGDADLGDTYYEHWLAALEGLCTDKQLVSRDAVDDRKEAWRQAYVNTPHGQPVELRAPFSITHAAPTE